MQMFTFFGTYNTRKSIHKLYNIYYFMNNSKTKIAFILLSLYIAVAGFAKPIKDKEIYKFVDKQFRVALTEIDNQKEEGNTAKILPRTLKPNGQLMLVEPEDWTSGFFPGSLWYLYEHTKLDFWKKQAEKYTHVLESQQFNTSNHDIGFMMYCSYGNGYRLTQSESYRDILIQSARSLSKRFNPTVGCIRSWDFGKDKWDFPVIIDNMMNLELLFWATSQTKDSSFYKIAVRHADVTMENHFRADGSSYHVVDYDTISGKARGRMTFQGYNDASAWARGQAWALYGYTVMYRETGDKKYLDLTQKIADFIFKHKNMPADLVPFWDFNAPKIPNVPKDASAASVIASSLFELAALDSKNTARYNDLAQRIMKSLNNDYRSKIGENRGFLLKQSTGFLPWGAEINVPLNYADYYYVEALMRMEKANK